MKLNKTYVLFDSGDISGNQDWAQAHAAIATAIGSMTWPNSADAVGFRIPRICTVRKGASYVGKKGKAIVVTDGDGKTLRNGVGPIRNQFRQRLSNEGWKPEHPLSLVDFFKTVREGDRLIPFKKYSLSEEEVQADLLNESVGDCDFWFKTDSGFRTVVEWETGNISSSHRSLNKMCMVLMGGLADAGVLVVPSIKMYPHLTDRIGNIRELQPYFYFWRSVGTQVKSGLLAVIEVEQDELFESTDQQDFIPLGSSGNSKAKRRRPRSSKKR
jgi:hypothetical protein